MLRLIRRLGRDDDGAVTVIVALSMSVILAMAALVIDVGALQARKAQLQDAADAAALAIAQQCFDAPGTMIANCDAGVRSAATGTALRYASDNLNGAPVAVSAVTFTSSTVAVSLSTTQDGIFSSTFGVDSTGVAADATAQWGQPAVALPLAYNECALPPASDSAVQFLRYDILDLSFQGCGLIGGVTDLLGPGWMTNGSCTWDVNLLTYIGTTLTKVLPTWCAGLVPSLLGKQVLLPVYSHVLTDIVINGVLLGHGYAVQKYALVEVTGYDFQTLNLGVGGIITATLGPKNITGGPQCPSLDLGIVQVEEPACQGLQGIFHGYLTPDEARVRLTGTQLIH